MAAFLGPDHNLASVLHLKVPYEQWAALFNAGAEARATFCDESRTMVSFVCGEFLL